MARTKQTARKTTGPRIFIHDQAEKRKQERQEWRDKIKRKKTSSHNSHGQEYSDIGLVTTEGQQTNTTIDVASWLVSKFQCHHHCTDGCFQFIPNITVKDLESYWEMHESIFGLNLRASRICDEKCDEESQKFAFEILDEFEKDHFSSKCLKFQEEEQRGKEKQEETCFEFKACGKVCIYYNKNDWDFEVCLFMMSKDEFVYVGQQGCHAFYGMPGTIYVNSDGR